MNKLENGDIVLNAENTIGFVYGDKVLTYAGEIPIESFNAEFALRYDGTVSLSAASSSALDKPPVYGSYSVLNAMLQAGLKILGHDPGVIDGWFGANTSRALKTFLAAENMDADSTAQQIINMMIGA